MLNHFSLQVSPFSWAAAERISVALNVPLVMGMALAHRGLSSPDEALAFLEPGPQVPDPFLLEGMQRATELLSAAIDNRRRIVVHGDYDVDGLAATALMALCLRGLGATCDTYVPSRFKEGYGLSEQAVRTIASEGDALLVTVDCGVNYPAEIALAQELGLQVVVTDHHQPGPELPDCPVVHQRLGTYPGPDLCGAGIAFKTLHGLYVTRGKAERTIVPAELAAFLDLVALGTVADIVPLRGENRYYVQEGLKRLTWSPRPGLRRLAEVAGCDTRADAGAIAFRLGPRLNAAGRLGNPAKALRVLLTSDDAEAGQLALELHALNLERQAIEQSITAQAIAQAEESTHLPHVLVLADAGWHEGVIGIVASRLVDRFQRPVILLSLHEGRARGSGRSIPAYDLMAGLRHSTGLLKVFGGHSQAAGLTLDAEKIGELRERLDRHAGSVLTPEDMMPTFSPDAVIGGPELTLETAEALSRLAPFGHGNEAVRLLALGVDVENPALTRTGEHMRCTLAIDGVRTRGIGFRFAPALDALAAAEGRIHAAFELDVHEWNGFTRPELKLHSLYETPDLGEAQLGCTPACPFRDDIAATPPCEHCADPFRGETPAIPIPGIDRRDTGAQLSRLAQIVSSGEPTAIVSSSVPHRLQAVVSSLPLRELGVTGIDCVSRLCWRTRLAGLRNDSLLFMDWPTAVRRFPLLAGKTHLVVLDPPYAAGHTRVLSRFSDNGGTIHLCYGKEEREFTEQLLRLMAHPRFAMVGLYRVLRDSRAWAEGDAPVHDAHAWRRDVCERAVEDMWAAHQFIPALDELDLAWRILEEMGLTTGDAGGEPPTKAEDIPLYLEREQYHEEAVRLCRVL